MLNIEAFFMLKIITRLINFIYSSNFLYFLCLLLFYIGYNYYNPQITHMSNKVNEQLFDLIKSMSKSEKRYFKVSASKHTLGGENNYVRLFDYLDSATEFDEKKLFDDFKGEAFLNKFSIAKKRLYDQLLASLQNYHTHSNKESQVYRMVHGADILYDKLLYSQAQKVLRSAEKISIKHQFTNAVIEIRRKQKRILEKNMYVDIELQEIESRQVKDQKYHDQSQFEDALWHVKSKLFMRLNSCGVARTKEDKINYAKIFGEYKKVKSPAEPTFESVYLINHIESAYFFAIQEKLDAYIVLQKNFLLFNDQTIFINEFPERYLSILTNLVYCAEELKLQHESKKHLAAIKTFEQALSNNLSEDLKVKLFVTISSIELSMLCKHGDFNAAHMLIPKIMEQLTKWEENISSARRAYILYKISTVFLINNQPNEALKTVRMIINDSLLEKKEEIVCNALLLEIIIHVELKNFDFIRYSAKNAQRFLKKKNRLYPYEQCLIQSVIKLANAQNVFAQEEIWQGMHAKLNKIGVKEDVLADYLNFTIWAESKFTSQSYTKILQQKLIPEKTQAA